MIMVILLFFLKSQRHLSKLDNLSDAMNTLLQQWRLFICSLYTFFGQTYRSDFYMYLHGFFDKNVG